jgi:hypothetical protein
LAPFFSFSSKLVWFVFRGEKKMRPGPSINVKESEVACGWRNYDGRQPRQSSLPTMHWNLANRTNMKMESAHPRSTTNSLHLFLGTVWFWWVNTWRARLEVDKWKPNYI